MCKEKSVLNSEALDLLLELWGVYGAYGWLGWLTGLALFAEYGDQC